LPWAVLPIHSFRIAVPPPTFFRIILSGGPAQSIRRRPAAPPEMSKRKNASLAGASFVRFQFTAKFLLCKGAFCKFSFVFSTSKKI
jgi:hypothetical protein